MKKDWEIKKLGELCELITKGTTPTSIGFDFQNQGINYVKIESFSEDGTIIENKVAHISQECHEALKRSQLQAGDILFSIAGALGRTAVIDESILPANTNQALAIIRLLKKDITFIKFLLYYFKTDFVIKQIEKDKGGVAQQNLSLKQIGDFEINIPPLEEQKRIVKILDEKFAQLETIKANAQNNLQNAKDLFQSQLTKAFSNTTWEKKRLGDCGSFKNGMNFAATDSGYTIRSLGVGDFKDRYSIDDTETLSEISLKAAPSEDYLLHDGDIVFVRSNGNKELVGRCVLVYPKDIPTTYSGFCIRFRKAFDLLDADFLLHFMKAESSRKILNGKEGANISNLNQKILGDFEVPLPPLPDQKRIVKELDTLSEKVKALQNIYEQMLLDCNELKQAYLQKAFEGEL